MANLDKGRFPLLPVKVMGSDCTYEFGWWNPANLNECVCDLQNRPVFLQEPARCVLRGSSRSPYNPEDMWPHSLTRVPRLVLSRPWLPWASIRSGETSEGISMCTFHGKLIVHLYPDFFMASWAQWLHPQVKVPWLSSCRWQIVTRKPSLCSCPSHEGFWLLFKL